MSFPPFKLRFKRCDAEMEFIEKNVKLNELRTGISMSTKASRKGLKSFRAGCGQLHPERVGTCAAKGALPGWQGKRKESEMN